MSITVDLRNLVDHYPETNANADYDLDRGRDYGGIRIKTDNGMHLHRNTIPAALTYSDYEHAFFVEPKGTVIPCSELKVIVAKYFKASNKNNAYSDVIDSKYSSAQLDKDINDNWNEHVYCRIESMIDMAIMEFIRYFGLVGLNRDVFEGKNIYFYPMEIREIIDDETRYKTREKRMFNEALRLGGEAKDDFIRLTKLTGATTKDIEDNILSIIFKLYDKDYSEFKLWACKKSGYGIGGHIAIKDCDWESMKNSWKLLKGSYTDIFMSNRFVPNDIYQKSYSTSKIKYPFVEYIDQLFNATDIERAWIELSNGVYAAFYGKTVTD